MPVRIAIIDRRIPNQADDYHPELRTWVEGARHTLEVDERDSPRRIVDWAARQAAGQGHIDLDLIAHGGGGNFRDLRVYVVKLGNPGFYAGNIHLWTALRGRVGLIRVYACGTESRAFGPGAFRDRTLELIRERYLPPTMAPRSPAGQPPTPVQTQHQLMAALARHTSATVHYSLNTMEGYVTRRTRAQSFAPEPMLSPAFSVSPDGRCQPL
jgi:hypothetical protein